ncbi:MAG TPA: beta-ketoacyl synthase N-terminal-like domain-containing protein, partial [Casimicrobiaceae bacterium]
MMGRRRVAITGIGLVTPIGNDVATTWASLDTVRNGAAPITLFDASGFTTRIAAEVKRFDERVITAPRKVLNFANRSHRFALAAAEEAMRDAGIEPTDEDGERWGCAVGTGMMGVDFSDLAEVQRHSARDGAIDTRQLLTDNSAADPRAFCRSQSTGGLALLTRRFGIRGCATSVH